MKRITRATRQHAVLPRAGSVPRDVRLTTNGRFVIGIALVFTAGALAAALILPIVRAGQVAERAALTAEAASVSATVVSVTRTKGDNPRHVITYRYSVEEREYQSTVRMSDRDGRRFPAGSSLPILYRRSQPASNWLPGREPDVLPVLLLPIAPFALLLIAGAFAWTVRRARVLLSEGRFADARVLTSTKVQGQHGATYRVRYEFTTLSGATVTGTLDRSRPAGSPGETIPIVYHRDNPHWKAVCPLSLVAPHKP